MNGKSGKLVAPAVAFMLCAVALIGVGFAISLNSTSTAGGNEVNNVNGVVLDLTGDGEGKAALTGTAAVYYDTVQSGANGTIKYNFAKEDMTIAAGNVAIRSPGNVTLTYIVTNVKVQFSGETTGVTVAPVLKVGSSSMTMNESKDTYTLSKTIEVTGEGAVKTGGENFTITLVGYTQDGETRIPIPIGEGSISKYPVKITYDLLVSAAYTV